METIAKTPVDVGTGRVYEHGWQSWSPTTTYRVTDRPHRPVSERNHFLCYRPGVAASPTLFQGEGLLALQPEQGAPVTLFAAPRVGADDEVPTITARLDGDRLIVAADGEVEVSTEVADLDTALARWAERVAAAAGVAAPRPAPTIWCSWYEYFTEVTEADIDENIATIDRLDLPVEVVQLDDGYQTAHGDWLTLTDRFESLAGVADRIRATERRAGIWVAPFLVFPDSELAVRHPEWLLGEPGRPVHAGHNWDRDLYALDTTHPGARAWLHQVFTTMVGWGFDFFKIDFLYAGALAGRRYQDVAPLAAYRSALAEIRSAVGDAYLLACGAPILPTVGLCDAMRVSPDTEPQYLPKDGDYSQPAVRSAMITGRGRAFQHGRFWVNDPDCLIARPAVEHREEWADHVERFGGLRGSSDRITGLDEWGLDTTRRLLSQRPPARFVDP